MESSPSSQQVVYLEISAEQAGQRIDNFLHTHFKGVPKSHIYRILRTGEVRVNKGRIKPTYRLQEKDIMRLPPVRYEPSQPQTPSHNSLNLLKQNILYEDNQLLIIDKPAGMAVHGGSGVSYGVIEGLRVLYPKLTALELVHRLDRDTSGCLMVAKKRSLLRQLHEGLQRGQIHKHYTALVKGRWNPHIKTVTAPLQKNTLRSGERVVRVDSEGKPALSEFSVSQTFDIATLVRVHLVTGRTHQIRVHSAYQGHPIAGDEKYGDETFNHQLRDYRLKRLFLHAGQLNIALTDPDYTLNIESPLPVDLKSVLDRLTPVTTSFS